MTFPLYGSGIKYNMENLFNWGEYSEKQKKQKFLEDDLYEQTVNHNRKAKSLFAGAGGSKLNISKFEILSISQSCDEFDIGTANLVLTLFVTNGTNKILLQYSEDGITFDSSKEPIDVVTGINYIPIQIGTDYGIFSGYFKFLDYLNPSKMTETYTTNIIACQQLAFQVNSDTQTCDEQGGSDIHFFLNVLAGTTLVYLEYNVTGEWESDLVPYNVAEGENDLLFAIDGTPPQDIEVLIRFVDVDNELTSEIYNWTLLSCQAGEVLSINSITNQSCDTETGTLTASFDTTINNVENGTVWIGYHLGGDGYPGEGWQQLMATDNNGGVYNMVNITEIKNNLDVHFRLILFGGSSNMSEIYTTDIIACEQVQEASIVLNYFDQTYTFFNTTGVNVQNLSIQESSDNVNWTNLPLATLAIPSTPWTGTDSLNWSGGTFGGLVNGMHYRIKGYDSFTSKVYSNSLQYT